jgi:DNA-binding MarR family transcriptional regulator
MYDKLFPAAIEIQIFAALLLKFYNEGLEARLARHGAGITPFQHGVLRFLQFEVLTISEISRRLGMEPSTVLRAVDVLEARGFLERGSDANDRRRRPLAITAAGRALLGAAPVISVEDPVFQSLAALGPERAATLRDLLRNVIAAHPEGKLVAELMEQGSNGARHGPTPPASAPPPSKT